MPLQMELSRIIINEINDQQVIYLREVEGDRMFPILIGIFEATSIDRRVKQIPTPRPLTHDLLVNTIEAMGAELQDVIISELREHTYYALLRVRHEGELIEIDARPSDAIAVAVTCEPALPIYVSEEVLNEVLGEES
ncbi:MAG: bifunctional nuclease family protein [Planctomycetales bacterium]|nr:bifunctional nuclease family protein [Planctomycetales bacterium]NIM10174.1 bifunctional nuclease family protein [Planctomycetales bacterium]NIN09600.1 bifunctional nuclease family protein [Planctomycetales bacterium]NIN78723.1 bifunctional nuclease family protein [Planctomycetales bacterium]NIO35900.1 bifunctional nuclease family protein [Planctomycetales bacterium]